jgi:hypothetical protein
MEQQTSNLIRQGIQSLQAGDTATARQLFMQVTLLNPEYQEAWLWLSDTTDNPYERREYLERCLSQNPDSRAGHIAHKKLARLLAGVSTTVPPAGQAQAPEPDERPARKLPLPPVWLGIVGVLLVGLLVWSLQAVLTPNAATNGEEVTQQPVITVPPTGAGTAAPLPESPPGSGDVVPALSADSRIELLSEPVPPDVPPDVRRYLQTANLAMQRIEQVISELRSALAEQGLNTPDGQRSMSSLVNTVQMAHASLDSIEQVPADMANLHRSNTAAADVCSQAVESLAASLDNSTTESIDETFTQFEQCNTRLGDAIVWLDAYYAANTVPLGTETPSDEMLMEPVEPVRMPPTPNTQPTRPAAEWAGIGIEREAWEAAYGAPDTTIPGINRYVNGLLWVTFEEGNVWRLEHRIPNDEPLSLDDARQVSQQFLPSDSAHISSDSLAQHEADDGAVDMYQSNWLRTRFSGEPTPIDNELAVSHWGMSLPGTFFVSYTLTNGAVTSYTISIGNAP